MQTSTLSHMRSPINIGVVYKKKYKTVFSSNILQPVFSSKQTFPAKLKVLRTL